MSSDNMKKSKVNKHFLPYDVYERHKKVASFIKSTDTVLDVGGELNHLSQFAKCAKIVVANLTSGNVIIKEGNLPFAPNSFDIVSSIDVLEHIPKTKRERFIKNLAKVASQIVILSFPLGTKGHLRFEKELARWLSQKGQDVTYLNEHIRYGLPTLEEVKKIVINFKTKVLFSGNITINRMLFKIFLFDPKLKIISRIVYWVKLLFNLLTNPIFFLFLADKPFSQRINRAYVLIFKKEAK